MKEKIAKWYKQSLWTEVMVKNALAKNILTKEDVNEILDKEG